MGIGPYPTSGGWAASDSSWMGSRHAVANAHPGTLKASAFENAPGVEGGVVPSGYPVAKDEEDFLVPYVAADGEGAGGNTLHGFSIDDRDISKGDEPTAVLWHGRIIVDRLPVDFEPPTDASAFVWA